MQESTSKNLKFEPDADAWFEMQEQARRVEEYLESLSPEQQEVVIKNDFCLYHIATGAEVN